MAVKIKAPQSQVVIPKAKQALKVKAAPKLSDWLELTEEQKTVVHLLATVVSQLSATDADSMLKEKEGYRKELSSLCVHYPTEKPVVFDTDEATVVFSAAAPTRVVKDMNGLIGVLKDKLGYPAMLAMLKIGVGEAEKYLTAAELEPFLEDTPGSRRLMSAVLKS